MEGRKPFSGSRVIVLGKKKPKEGGLTKAYPSEMKIKKK